MIVERRKRTMFRATRLVPYSAPHGDRDDVEQHRWFDRASSAYNWIASGCILRIRDRESLRTGGHWLDNMRECRECRAVEKRGDPGKPWCKWHNLDRYNRIRARIARLIRHYDELSKQAWIPSPSPEGMRAVETLRARGCTVAVNPPSVATGGRT